MKRYRVFGFEYDTRANVIGLEIKDSWDVNVKKVHHENKIKVIASVLNEFGTLDSETKLQDFLDFGYLPMTVIAYHNRFLRQVRDAFTIGAYYPALTGATALGERILNHLFHGLKKYYKDTPEYSKFHRKQSIQDWSVAIKILDEWDVLLPEVVESFKTLANIRNKKAIHFNPQTDLNDREYALEAIHALLIIVRHQFSAFGSEPWFIKGTKGACFIKKEAESLPFIQVFYLHDLPNCVLVSPYHRIIEMRQTRNGIEPTIEDIDDTDQEISDEEFVELFNRDT